MIKIPSILAVITYALAANGMDAEKINKLNNQENLIPETIIHEETETDVDIISICPQQKNIPKEIETILSLPFTKANCRLMFHLKHPEDYTNPSILWSQCKQYGIEEKKLPIKKRRLSGLRALKTRKVITH
ncbi:MAG: hypothetical protein K0M45_04765 [Candidatus Paracaedibacteraceae bacterium]|nr:hypothetical protein [Candidatus Paracaedibacteraceae bacterium]